MAVYRYAICTNHAKASQISFMMQTTTSNSISMKSSPNIMHSRFRNLSCSPYPCSKPKHTTFWATLLQTRVFHFCFSSILVTIEFFLTSVSLRHNRNWDNTRLLARPMYLGLRLGWVVYFEILWKRMSELVESLKMQKILELNSFDSCYQSYVIMLPTWEVSYSVTNLFD